MAVNGEFVRRLADQCERFGVPHHINTATSPEMVKAAVIDAMRALSGVTGVAVESADFIGLVEAYEGRRYFEYWR
jgi:aspartate aminotransferase-like enzyme